MKLIFQREAASRCYAGAGAVRRETLAEPVWPRLKTRCGHIIIKYSNRHIRNASYQLSGIPAWPRLKTRCGHIIINYIRFIWNMSLCICV